MATILVSNCLLGCECRYKGDSCRNERILSLAGDNIIIGVCPEQQGGLPTPRDPGERVGDKVISSKGRDITEQYRKGSETALFLAKMNKVDFAIMKENSPSCGKGVIYDGTFSGAKCAGNGTTVELLLKNGIPVYSENELDDLPLQK